MKLTDFSETDQNIILSRINLEKEEWERRNKIKDFFRKIRGDKDDSFLEECFEKFTKFYSQVTANEDIEEAFFGWSGIIFPEIDSNKINAPQFGFYEMYRGIKRALDIQQLQTS